MKKVEMPGKCDEAACNGQLSQLQDAFDVLSDAFVLYDAEDRLVLCNKKYKEFYAVSAELIEPGRTFEEIVRGGVALGQYPEALGREEEWIAERLRAHLDPKEPVEQKLKDGRWLRIEERRTSEGGIVGFRVDITELKRREESLRMSGARMRAIVESALDCIIMIDAEGRITEFNGAAEATFGYARDDAIGQLMSDLIVPERHREGHKRGMQHYLETGEGPILGKRIEVEAIRADGSELMVELAVEVAEDEGGPIFIAYLRDITQRHAADQAMREAKEKAEEANRAKAGFLAMMSHEIRTPLNGVLGMLGLLEDTQLDDEQHAFVDSARLSGEGLLDIISDILDFSKIEAGKLEFEYSSFALKPLLESVVDILSPKAAEQGIDLGLSVHDDVPAYVEGDPGRLRQVVLNLASNAVKFTEKGGVDIRVDVTGERHGTPLVRFSVIDTGIGIPEEKHAELFGEFTTLDPSYSRKYGGTGLGLAISRRLVDVMDGDITFDSAPGKGTTFTFTVPLLLSAVSDVVPVEPKAGNVTSGPSRRLRILLAEDNQTNRLVARSMLVKAGHHVETAANGLEAVEALSARAYDAVLMDVSMPEMDGLQATRKIRSLSGDMATVPIIALTAHAMVDDRESFIAAGMNDYLCKPVSKKAVMDVLAKWAVDKPDDGGVTARTQLPEMETTTLLDRSVLSELAEETEPELIPVFIGSFLEDVGDRMEKVEAAIKDEDYDALEHECHTLGSSAATFGVMQFHTIARLIERRCRGGNFTDIEGLYDPLREAAAEATKVLEDYVQNQAA